MIGKRVLGLGAGLLLLFAAAVSPAAAGADTGPTGLCTFKPVLPSRVSIGQAVVGLNVRLAYNDPNCATTAFNASAYLVHGVDSPFLNWNETSKVDNLTLYASEISPGHYVTTAGSTTCYAPDFSYAIPSQFLNAGTVIKFTGRVNMGVARNGSTVTVSTRTIRFVPYDGFHVAGGIIVNIQRYNPTTRVWQTIKRATTNSVGGYVFSYTNKTVAKYRVVTDESAAAFSATSGMAYK
jgi:hypothetical protein